MASNGNVRGNLLTAGGVLSLAAGIYLIGIGVSVAVSLLLAHGISPHDVGWGKETLYRSEFFPFLAYSSNYWWVIIGGCVGITGIVAIVGGLSAIKRKRFGLALAGAICAIVSGPLGILAVIFVALRKREFRGEGLSGI